MTTHYKPRRRYFLYVVYEILNNPFSFEFVYINRYFTIDVFFDKVLV